MALVEADDGRLALVKARDGAFLADGDEVFSERAAALGAFERSRDASGSSRVGWALHATPGLVEGEPGEVTEIDPSALADDPAMRLVAAPLSRVSLPQVGRFLALAVMVAGVAVVWTQRDALWRLIAGPERTAEAEQEPVEPPVMAVLDAGALIAGCRQALTAHPPYMPAWRTERISCEGRFAESALIGVRPELEDRAVLAVRWRLESGRPEPLHRRIAETHLSRWYAASVTGDRAWAVMPLAPVLRLRDGAGERPGTGQHSGAPLFLAFREAVDRHFGMAGAGIEYPPQDSDGIEVRIATRRVPFRLADAVAAVPGLELVRLARNGAGEWRLEGRRVLPAAMPRERFEQVAGSLTGSAAHPAIRSQAGPEGEAGSSATGSASAPVSSAATGSAGDAVSGTIGDAAGGAVGHTTSDGGSGS